MARGLSAEAASLLTSEPLMAHLATSHEDRPHVAPVWFDYHDGRIEVMTGGRKLRNVRANPRVALSVQKDVDGDARWMVTMQGTASVVDDGRAAGDARRRINRKYGEEADAYPENALVRIDVGSASVQRYD